MPHVKVTFCPKFCTNSPSFWFPKLTIRQIKCSWRWWWCENMYNCVHLKANRCRTVKAATFRDPTMDPGSWDLNPHFPSDQSIGCVLHSLGLQTPWNPFKPQYCWNKTRARISFLSLRNLKQIPYSLPTDKDGSNIKFLVSLWGLEWPMIEILTFHLCWPA